MPACPGLAPDKQPGDASSPNTDSSKRLTPSLLCRSLTRPVQRAFTKHKGQASPSLRLPREAPLSMLTCCGEVLFCSRMLVRCLMEWEDEEPLFLLFTGNALSFSSQLLRVP